ncbi:MAG: chromate transporter [Nitrospirae bacterium CG_4_10_14_0_8_um_filter_41_23]|nr:chromate transporter [Nitrospirota bacterium]PIQ93048.1 MAG: chromate transporter [Nitrospirae bacterium CG11_big_fil_rev_8_21_14_0_20_41_14]PIV43972.1 MAG: chromate transporter [Nitrospirae bacterium CG02_land_8_20_14_3_00_41_53]PIW86717.1 MAG: chromate transporter [Nitrospirae bacterium CG_4_8_14_3_um_filter_41_47]PIY86762.1 MAG: chromate transporter [Nitrospirae bacterium CG_4_10_14_0_8_um_filter_41_23]PJA80762.1 MAG: chromate transporter [Nitrospirae bacterium CG_4_9_14_3_um_filter_41_2
MILLKFCWILIVVNALTIGGGFVMLPMLQKEFVEKYHWLTNKEFMDAIAIGQVTPGPLTVMNAFMGYKIYGLLGAIMAMISSYLPCIIIVTLVAKYYYTYKKSVIVISSFNGIKPAVIGLLAAVAISLGNTSLVDPITFGIAIISFAVIAFTKIDPTFVIIGAGVMGALFL